MGANENKKLAEKGLTAWDKHDPESFLAVFADKVVFKDTGLPQPLTDKASVKQYMQGWFAAFPDMRLTKKAIMANDDGVLAAELEWTGTHKGPLQGPPGTTAIPATGKKVVGKGAFFAKVRNDKVVEFSAYPDNAGIMMQLGLMGPGK